MFAGLLVSAWHDSTNASSTKPLSPGTLSLRAGVTTPSFPITLTPDDPSLGQLRYEQNPAPKFGGGADLGWAGFYLSVLPLEPEQLTEEYGSSDYLDFQFHLFFGSLGVDLYYQNFSGYYYLANENSLPTLRPDIQSTNRGFNLIWVFEEEDLSLSAALNNIPIVEKSGGSWMLLFGSGVQELRGDTVLAPEGFERDYGRLGNMNFGRFSSVAVGGGYGYTWVFAKPFFIHASLTLGLGPQLQEFQTESDGWIRDWGATGKGVARIAIGCNVGDFFAAIQGMGDSYSVTVEEKILTMESSLAFLYLGYRFDLF